MSDAAVKQVADIVADMLVPGKGETKAQHKDWVMGELRLYYRTGYCFHSIMDAVTEIEQAADVSRSMRQAKVLERGR